MQSTADEPSHLEAILALLQETLAHNGKLWNSILETERVAQRHRHMSKTLFMKGYPVGKILFRGIVAMTKNFVMRDERHRSRPGSGMSQEYVKMISDYANEAVVRITRGHARDAAAEHQDHGEAPSSWIDCRTNKYTGILLFQQHVITWTVDKVVSQPDCLRRAGRPHVQSTFGFYSGRSSLQHNRKQHHRAVQDDAFMRNTLAVVQLFKKFYILDPSSLAWQLEYAARLTPSSMETLPGETPVILWSVSIPDCGWIEVVTIVSFFNNGNSYSDPTLLDQIDHILREWQPGKWVKMGFDEHTAQFSDTLYEYAMREPGVRRICEELVKW
jgi:hypothetical protein